MPSKSNVMNFIPIKSFLPKYHPIKNIKQKYAIAHSDMIVPFPVLMHWFKTK